MSESQEHRIRQGECLASIAHEGGIPRNRIWEDAANDQLRNDRDPFLLCPGDRLTIPTAVAKEESASIENRHIFRRVLEPTELRILMLENGEPRADVAWALLVDGWTFAEGTTSIKGEIETNIDPSLKECTLQFGRKDKPEQYHLLLGSLDPLETVGGIQARLVNLGFDPGPVDGRFGPLTEKAIRAFQHTQDLDMNGRIDDATQRALHDAYGC